MSSSTKGILGYFEFYSVVAVVVVVLGGAAAAKAAIVGYRGRTRREAVGK